MDNELLKEFGRRFLERRDVKAVQFAGGGYTPEREPFTLKDLRAHVTGTKTYGHYILSTEDKCRIFAFDLDVMKPCPETCAIDHDHLKFVWTNPDNQPEAFNPREALLDESHWARPLLIAQLNGVAEGLARRASRTLDVPVAVAWSGAKGMHVYGFTGSEDAALVRRAAHGVLRTFGCWEPSRGENFYRHKDGAFDAIEIEVFPKQDSLEGKDLGNLMRLPLGINRKTGKRGFFLQFGPPPTELTELDPMEALRGTVLQQHWAQSAT